MSHHTGPQDKYQLCPGRSGSEGKAKARGLARVSLAKPGRAPGRVGLAGLHNPGRQRAQALALAVWDLAPGCFPAGETLPWRLRFKQEGEWEDMALRGQPAGERHVPGELLSAPEAN